MTPAPSRDGQRGAALILVILLVATLSFIALAISERTVLAASRTGNARLRGELLWRAVGAEALARRAIEAAYETDSEKLTRESPLVAKPIEIPMEGGVARLAVFDRTRCFNVNSLVDENGAADEAAAEELSELLSASGATFDYSQLAAVIVDWIDVDTLQGAGGAEDNAYTLKPVPYRTGSHHLADISELRAMSDVGREQYRTIAPFLCAQPDPAPSQININMLTSTDAPLIVGLMQGKLSTADAQEVIEARPPGGYAAVSSFLEQESIAAVGLPAGTAERLALTSRYLEVTAAIEYYDASLGLSMMFKIEDDRVQLISRRLGWYE